MLQKVVLMPSMLKEAIQTIRGAVMICYPQGLPSYDPVQQAITGTVSCTTLFLSSGVSNICTFASQILSSEAPVQILMNL